MANSTRETINLQPTARWLLQLAGVLAFTFITDHTHAYIQNKPPAPVETAQAAIESIAPCLADPVGYLSKLQDKSGTTLYERDAFGRILSKTQLVNDNPASPSSYKTSYAYSSAAGTSWPASPQRPEGSLQP